MLVFGDGCVIRYTGAYDDASGAGPKINDVATKKKVDLTIKNILKLGFVAGLLNGTGVLAGFMGGKDTDVVEGTVTSTPTGLEGEIVTGFVAGTVMMVGVSGGVIMGVDDTGFIL
ncbi:hypothetical protein DEO72_LG8g1220 [Vigna unguiculata]|uniref:Uncharacterized protein n=1 Tax=Vigna unguiculata TaxID=3917 RepID=A0A4D6MQ93_VIGUN|nr:hypothetical protein DEO72_LG8g1220 [Vigna unguiculata]